MTPLQVVIAPDSFKGSATAAAAAAAIALGWKRVRPHDTVQLVPMADGGEGTMEAFAAAVTGAQRMPITTQGPDRDEVASEWLLLPDGTAVIELAATSGITLLEPLRPFDAHTRGFGQAIVAALDHSAQRLLLALGGSSSTDGGAGALMELGAWLTDASGEPIPLGNRGLARLEHADFRGLRPLPPRGAIVLTDVSNPLLGDAGAATVFGPQKGAGAEDLPILDQNLRRLARLLPVELDVPGAGAAGGTAFGLLAWGASLAPGSSAVGTALGLREAVRGADVVITGEGRFDSQSAAGKVPSHVLDLAREASVSALLVAGRIDAATDPFAGAVSLTDLAGGSGSAQATALRWLEAAGERLAAGVRR